MELKAVASVVIEKLKDILPSEMMDIKQALEEMQGFSIDTDEERQDSEEVIKWAKECLDNLYHVEDAVESFALRIARQRKKWDFLTDRTLFLKNFMACQKLRRKMKRISSDTKQLIDEKPRGIGKHQSCSNGFHEQRMTTHLDDQNGGGAENGDSKYHINNEGSAESNSRHRAMQQHSYTMNSTVHTIDRRTPRCVSNKTLMEDREKHAKLMYSNTFDEEELEIVGIRKDVHCLVECLTDDSRGLIVGIAGEMGSGKTTLARAIYGSRKIKNHFKSRCAWVTISKESNKSDVLQNFLKQLGYSKDCTDLTDELQTTRILECLNGENFFIVLDDVRSDQWDELKTVFLDSRNESTLLLIVSSTTINMLQEMLPKSPNVIHHNVKGLSEQKSWDLFLKKAGWHSWKDSSELKLKKRILGVCKCQPLNIVLLGSLLSTKESPISGPDTKPLSSSLKEATHPLFYLLKILNSQTTWETKDIVSRSYTDLPYHLKPYLLYLVLFPKEYDIPVRRLLRLWLAEGFVKHKQGNFPEDVVQENFDDLVKRSLIQISKLRSDGSPRRCRLLGVLHDYLLPKAQNIRLFHVHRTTSSGEVPDLKGVRRLVEHASSKNIYTDASQLEHLRSYLSFNFQRKDTPAKEVGSLLRCIIGNGFGLLRVLDLEGLYKPSLPENLGDLLHLRYLGLRWTFLDALPSSVGDLPYLETLDVKHTNINSLPTSMWKLKHLRHLNLSGMLLDMPKHSDCSSFPKLLTLWGLSVDDESPVKNGLNRLRHLREAGITFCLSNCEDLLNWISDLTALQSLRLRSKNDIGHPSHFGCKPLSLSRLEKLSHLNLLGELPRLLVEQNLPQGLKVLTLSVSKLTEDPMPILGKLSQLNVLRLLANSYVGKKIVCLEGGFKELRVLKLWMLENLEEWNVEDRAMEKLKEINIRCCHKLKSIPTRLMIQISLRELVITNMHQDFKQNVERKRSQHVTITVKDYDFTPMP